jgi:hypothetical protein
VEFLILTFLYPSIERHAAALNEPKCWTSKSARTHNGNPSQLLFPERHTRKLPLYFPRPFKPITFFCQILDILLSAEGRSSSIASQKPPTTSSKRNHRKPNCARISTREISEDNESQGRGFGRYVPIDRANAKIRSALLSSDTTEDVQVAGIGTTKSGYSIQYRLDVSRNLG